jgi:DNA polymerase
LPPVRQLFTVHDEAVMEAAVDGGYLAEVERLMGEPIAWAPDLPLRADGFASPYYMKEIE